MDRMSLRRLWNCNLVIEIRLQFQTKCDEFLDVMLLVIVIHLDQY